MWLSWISDEKLSSICKIILEQAKPEAEGLRYKNIVDPFSALFDLALYGLSFEEWKKLEIRRQQQKTLQNALGNFHQKVLGAVDGWEDLGVGEILDLKSDSRKIVAEIKNKFNTVKASDNIGIYEKLAHWRGVRAENKVYTAYYVQILTKKGRFDRPFTPTDNTKAGIRPAPSEFIREIDGRSFYALVTGVETAFDDLYHVLPNVLEQVSSNRFNARAVRESPLYQELFDKIP